MDYPSQIIMMGELDSSIVKQIQNRLNELGCGPIDVDGIYVRMTVNAVKAYQSRHCDTYGVPLKIDGRVGILTWTGLFGGGIASSSIISPLQVSVVEIAAKEIGVVEDPPGSNSGPRVNEYLSSVGLAPGYAWCAGYVYWCFGEAAAKLNRANPVVKTAGCIDHWRRTLGYKIAAKGAIANPSLIEPGSIFIMSRGGGQGHTGIVKSVNDGYIDTIEGNTNSSFSAEGGGVFELRRKITSINIGFIKYS
jgi:hypothetical protein